MQSEAPGVAPEVPEWFISPGHTTQGGPAQLQGTEFKFCAAQGAPGPPALHGAVPGPGHHSCQAHGVRGGLFKAALAGALSLQLSAEL